MVEIASVTGDTATVFAFGRAWIVSHGYVSARCAWCDSPVVLNVARRARGGFLHASCQREAATYKAAMGESSYVRGRDSRRHLYAAVIAQAIEDSRKVKSGSLSNYASRLEEFWYGGSADRLLDIAGMNMSAKQVVEQARIGMGNKK